MRLNGKLRIAATAAAGLLLAGTTLQAGPAFAGGNSARVSASTANQRVQLGLNKSVVIDLPSDAYDILVANPAVADAVTAIYDSGLPRGNGRE